MLFNLLDAAQDAGQNAQTPSQNSGGTWIFIIIMVAMLVITMIMNRRSQQKRAEEQNKTLDAIQPGNKVKTIGGICGIVVEVCDDNTFVVETGTEKSGKSYLKIDKQAVYQTDAQASTQAVEQAGEPVLDEQVKPAEEVFEEAAPENNAEENK